MRSFLEGDGQMARAIDQYDWSSSEVGIPEQWPAVLKTTVSLILNSRFPQCVVWGQSLVTIPNDAFLLLLGDKPAALGRPFSEVWQEVWPSLEPIVAKAYRGEATYIEDFPLSINRRGFLEPAYFTFCYSPIRDENGHIVGMLDTVTETTGKVELHERQKVLFGEMGHRLKNLLSVVQAVARQTLRQSPDLKSAQDALAFRLAAFGRAADVLTASQWDDADLHTLIKAAVAGHETAAGRFHVEGPALRFRSEVALGLTLALYELATNAVKYGALSNETGRVEVKWSVDDGSNGDDARFRLSWREIGGPPVTEPTRRGFGSQMIERSLRGYLQGDVAVHYLADGLLLEIDAPLTGKCAERGVS